MRHIEKAICIRCGKEFETRAYNAKYCSRYCSNLRYSKKKIKAEFQCPHNEGVVCDKKRCESCGWNPVVAQRRKEAYA